MVILEVGLKTKRATMAIDSSSDDDENMAAPVVLDLQEALGVTPTGNCSRHPNCPVLSLVHNKVMSCRVCFSEEKSVGIRQRKSFAAVVQQLSKQQQAEAEDDEKKGENGDDTPSRKIKRAHSASMQALILQQPQTMESIMKRLGQVQNWMLRQKEKEVMSLQLHIQRLEQRLHDTEVQNQEQKQTIWALRRTIQQDLKIIKTMAVQHEREQLENGSTRGGGGGLGWGSSHRSVSDGSASTGMDLRSPKFALDTASLSSAENTPTPSTASPMKLLPPLPGESPQSGVTNSSVSSRKKGQIVDKYRMSGLRAYTSSGSLAPQQSLRSLMEKSGDQSGGGYLNKDIFVEHQRSSYWNDEEVDRLSTNPSKMFASFRGGLLDIPKSPPKARHDNTNRQKLQLNADDLAQLKMPKMRGVGRTWSHASAASGVSNDDGSTASFGGGLGGAPTLLSLPVSIGETSPEPAEVLFEDPESTAEAAETRKAAMPPPPLNSPSPQNAKLPARTASSQEDELNTPLLETAKIAATQQDTTVEKGKVNTEPTTDKTVLTATYSITSLYSRQSSTTFASGYDQRSETTGSVSADEEGETGGDYPQAGKTQPKAEEGAEQSKEGLLFEVTGSHCQDNFGDTGMYVGTILVTEGMPHGEGTMTYDSGRVYSGNWVCGQWHGKGKLLNPNGDTYEGDFIFDARHGMGVYKWDNGDVYTGDFSQDKRNGHGKFCFHNGNVYEGEFRDGMFEGFGRYDFDEGSYEGEWVEGRYHGEGTLTYASGGKYTGEFRDSLAHGFGLEVLPDGSKRRGMWEAGQPTQNFAKP
jgi:hypothetical protein